VTSITYNEMDKPLAVSYADGSTIKNTYTGGGTLIKKDITSTSLGTEGVYQYWGPFVYKGDGTSTPPVLQYALNEQGRARYDPTANLFTFDYFVKDHLGNVRTVVTGNQQNLPWTPGSTRAPEPPSPAPIRDYVATHEVLAAGVEDAVFTNIDRVRAEKPESTDPADTKAAGLNGDDTATMIGTAILLKVMAGDQFTLQAQSYWTDDSTFTTDSSSTMLSALLGTMSNAQAQANLGENGAAGQIITNTFTPANYALYQGVVDSIANPSIPQAFLNYMVFDQYMNLIPGQSGAIQVGATPDGWQVIGTDEPITVSQSGYVAIYISDASTKLLPNGNTHLASGGGDGGDAAPSGPLPDVYIDHIVIGVNVGTLIQEQHYYPFGLSINEGESATITPNRYEYQGQLLTDDLGYNLYDFTARQYDMQIGRFWGVDPASQFPSGYTGMGNDPANLTDPTGCTANGGPYMGANSQEDGSSMDGINDPFINVGGHMTDPTQGSTGGQEAIQALKDYEAALTQTTSSGSGAGQPFGPDSRPIASVTIGNTTTTFWAHPLTGDALDAFLTAPSSDGIASYEPTHPLSIADLGPLYAGPGDEIKKSFSRLDAFLSGGQFLEPIYGPASPVGSSWNNFSNSHMISENTNNGILGDWSGDAGFYNYGLPTINATFGTLSTLTGVGALATGLNLGTMGAGAVLWNATSVTLGAYNTLAPGNQVTERTSTLMDMIEVINSHPNPASIINFGIQGLDNLSH